MPNYPWFRLYSADLLSDRKLLRIARACQVPMAIVRGVWLTLLAMANDSPERGCLLISDGIPVTEEEIRCELGLDPATFEALLSEMEALNMIARGECIVVTKFVERNPPSDSSTERVQRYRARKRREQQRKPVTETLPEQPGNAIEGDLEEEGEEEEETEGEQSALRAPPPGAPHPAISLYEQATDRSVPNDSWRQRIQETVGLDPPQLELWSTVLDSWIGHGWNPANLDGLLDCFQKGGVQERGNGSGRREPMPTKEAIKRSYGGIAVNLQPDDASSALSAGKPP